MISQGPLPSKPGWTSYVAPLSLDLTVRRRIRGLWVLGLDRLLPDRDVLPRPLRDPRRHPVQHRADRPDRLRMADDVRPPRDRRATAARRVGAGRRHEQPVLDHLEHAAQQSGHRPGAGANRRRRDGQADRSRADRLPWPKDRRISIAGLDSPSTVPGGGRLLHPGRRQPRDATLSQDGTKIAWKDDRGRQDRRRADDRGRSLRLLVTADRISATGSSPSIGGADVAQLRPARLPRRDPAPGPGARRPAAARVVPAARAARRLRRRRRLASVATVPAKGSATAIAGPNGLR